MEDVNLSFFCADKLRVYPRWHWYFHWWNTLKERQKYCKIQCKINILQIHTNKLQLASGEPPAFALYIHVISPGFTGNCPSSLQGIAGCCAPFLAWLSSPTSSKIISLWRRSRVSRKTIGGKAQAQKFMTGIVGLYNYKYIYIIINILYIFILFILLFFGHSSDSTTSCTSSERVCAGNSWGWEVRDQTLRLQVTGPPSTVHGDDLRWSISMAVAMCGVWLHIHVSSCLHPSFSFLTFLWSLAN